MIKTAIIGASGYIGAHLLNKYRETFPDCIGTCFSHSKESLTPFDLRHPDIKMLNLQETGHQSVVISSAMPNIAWCDAHPEESYELNVKGTLSLVKQLAEQSITTIFFSSDYVFNGESGPYSDKALTCPNTEYGRQKAEVEREIPNLTDKYAILRLSKIYGTTWKDNTLIDLFAAALMDGQKITVATDQFFSPTHVDDVVNMVLYIQDQRFNGLVNLCHPQPYSRSQIAHLLADTLDVSPTLLQDTSLHLIPGMEKRPLNTSLVCSPILKMLHSSLISMDEAIQRIASNWKQHEISTKLKTA